MIFAFPPTPLIRACVCKARADQVRGFFIVPVATTAPYWGRLLAASIIRTDPGYATISNVARFLQHAGAYSVQKLAVFVVDFRRAAATSCQMPSSPVCGREFAARGRSNPGSLADEAHRACLRVALLQLSPRDAGAALCPAPSF